MARVTHRQYVCEEIKNESEELRDNKKPTVSDARYLGCWKALSGWWPVCHRPGAFLYELHLSHVLDVPWCKQEFASFLLEKLFREKIEQDDVGLIPRSFLLDQKRGWHDE